MARIVCKRLLVFFWTLSLMSISVAAHHTFVVYWNRTSFNRCSDRQTMFINELLLVLTLLLIFMIKQQIHSVTLQPFYWNHTTFRPYPDDSLIFEVRLGDVMDLICPFYDEQESYMLNEFEQYDIYRVTKTEYDMCSIDQFNLAPTTRIVITCNSPYDVMKYTLNFRSYLPIPNGLEFHPNQTYYFLSTSPTTSSSDQRCYKLKIDVRDYQRSGPSSTTVSSLNEKERKSPIILQKTNPRQDPSPVYPSVDSNDRQHLFSQVVKAQRHSDPYSIKWITEGPQRVRDSADQSYRTTSTISASMAPTDALTLALSSSSSAKLSLPSVLILGLFLCLSIR